MAARAGARSVPVMFKRIVIGFDDSTSAHDAVALALTLADDDARVALVCAYPTGGLTSRVVPPSTARSAATTPTPGWRPRARCSPAGPTWN